MDVAIIGVTETGRRFAKACATAGFSVSIHAEDANSVLDAIDSIGSAGAGDSVDGTTDLASAVSGADRIVYCVDSSVEDTRDRLATVESYVDDPSFLAVAVDTRPIGELSVALRDPSCLVGLRPFSDLTETGQVSAPPVEVIRTEATAETTVDAIRAFVTEIMMTPLVVGDGPGFVAGRLLLALQAEAMRTVEDGVADAATVDQIYSVDGRTQGPLERADRTGLERVQAALEYMAEWAGPRFSPPDILDRKIAAGDRGRDSGAGFYEWEAGSIVGPASDE